MLYFHKRKTGGISLDRVMELREKTKEKIERKKLKEQEKADNAEESCVFNFINERIFKNPTPSKTAATTDKPSLSQAKSENLNLKV